MERRKTEGKTAAENRQDALPQEKAEKKPFFWEETVRTAKEKKAEEAETFGQERRRSFCGGENGGSKGDCAADGGGKHAGEKKRLPRFLRQRFFGRNGATRSGRKAENDFYAGSTFCGAGEAETIRLWQKQGLPKKAAAAEEAEDVPQEAPKKEREQAKGAEIDIERLMREMTKRLWEEREASGRRLRR